MKNRWILLILLAAAAVSPLYAQGTEPSLLFDYLFDDYVELETEILNKYDSGTLERWDLGVINDFRLKIEGSGRDDILSRLDMLSFIVESETESRRLNANADEVIAGIADAEKEYRAELKAKEGLRIGAGTAIGTAAVSGVVFATASLLSADFYYKYTQTELADQAAFNLFWFQTLDRIALGGAITGLISGAAAAVLAALY